MTNCEKHKAEIEPITRMGIQVAIERDTNKICTCGIIRCKNCLFYDDTKCCEEVALAWADAEYIEPQVDWSKVAVDTPILVSDDEKHWHPRYFAKRSDGKFYAFSNGSTSWSGEVGRATSWLYAKLAEVDKDGI